MNLSLSKDIVRKQEQSLVRFDDKRRLFFKSAFVYGSIFLLSQNKLIADWTFEFEVNLGIIRFLIRYDSNMEIGENPPSGEISAGKLNGKEIIVNYALCQCKGIYNNLVSNPENPNAEDIDRMINSSVDGSIRYKY